ncbi:MAG: 50S ribosomal protein L25/general stress protein Ctc [Acidobacteria bacterium 13_1_40CM_56_16]|nr:MAG: 50S ribosomal protein L25/general stress protein Ctc [Acidobacteria bacterium 13_1_40CM_56_16]
MAEIVISATNRADRGKNAARRLRRRGLVPGIVYGGKGENLAVAVDPKALQRVLRSEAGRNAILKLSIADHGSSNAILKNWQVDPVKESFLHADFYRIAMDVAIRVTVPIHVVGEARGVKVDAGILELVIREIEVECLPGDIPERIAVDVADLGINQSLRVSDVPIPAKVKVLQAADQVVVHVVAVKEEEAAPAAAAAPVAEGEAAAPGAEPEVIKKGKKEEEEAPPEPQR